MQPPKRRFPVEAKDVISNLIAGVILAAAAATGEWFLAIETSLQLTFLWLLLSHFLCLLLAHYQSRNTALRRARAESDERIRQLEESHEEELRRVRTEAESKALALLGEAEARHGSEMNSLKNEARLSVEEVQAKHRKDKLLEISNFQIRSDAQHLFSHSARDLIVNFLERGMDSATTPLAFTSSQKKLLEQMLQQMFIAFQTVCAEDAKIFVALRERRGDEFYTIIRKGQVDSLERDAKTSPMHVKFNMVQELERSFRGNKDCVLITGCEENTWQKMDNDGRKEDLSVMMGAVFTKRHAGRNVYCPIRLEWILFVAADKHKVFSEHHKGLMKAFNDVFGAALNVGARHQFNPPLVPPSITT